MSQHHSSIFGKRSGFLVRPGSPQELSGKPSLPYGFGLKSYSPSLVAPIFHSLRFTSRLFRTNGKNGWMRSSWALMQSAQRNHSEKPSLAISRDCRRAQWRITVRWWRKSGAALEKQVSSGSFSVLIGRQYIRAPETTGNKIWSVSKVSSMLSQRNPTCKIILLIVFAINTYDSRQRAKRNRPAGGEPDSSKRKRT